MFEKNTLIASSESSRFKSSFVKSTSWRRIEPLPAIFAPSGLTSGCILQIVGSLLSDKISDNRTDTIKFFFSAMEAAKLFTPRRAAMLQQSSIACHSAFALLDFAGHLSNSEIRPLKG